eukprot:TRINITY_DN31677_c0_g1_i1.p1 TRINITY_DN31677_c0_g1~~TRINITY_DN31677_c0_g1_i1.p1  ORF type:complete len:151 (-),score=20.99 TRINITY_DN31677_c0_g1_i1:25-477(-)
MADATQMKKRQLTFCQDLCEVVRIPPDQDAAKASDEQQAARDSLPWYAATNLRIRPHTPPDGTSSLPLLQRRPSIDAGGIEVLSQISYITSSADSSISRLRSQQRTSRSPGRDERHASPGSPGSSSRRANSPKSIFSLLGKASCRGLNKN